MKLREYRTGDLEKIADALDRVAEAIGLLRDAGAARAATAVARARKSVEGAKRHAQRLQDRQYVLDQQARQQADRQFNRGFAIGLRRRKAE